MSDDWARYYQALAGRPPRPTLVYAARRFARPGLAVDLGSGGGRDAAPLLRAGWHVVAVEREASGHAALRAAVTPAEAGRLTTIEAAIESADWPIADLVNSSFALPLVPKAAFPLVWRRIRERLAPGGRFSGQLYGPRDSWAKGGSPDGVVAHSREACLRLFHGMTIEFFEEEEHDGLTPKGRQKHWHIFHCVARAP